MRCYNGAWDSEAQQLFKEHERLFAQIKKIEPEAYCTYFPVGEFYQVHVWGRTLGTPQSTKLAALQDALRRLS